MFGFTKRIKGETKELAILRSYMKRLIQEHGLFSKELLDGELFDHWKQLLSNLPQCSHCGTRQYPQGKGILCRKCRKTTPFSYSELRRFDIVDDVEFAFQSLAELHKRSSQLQNLWAFEGGKDCEELAWIIRAAGFYEQHQEYAADPWEQLSAAEEHHP